MAHHDYHLFRLGPRRRYTRHYVAQPAVRHLPAASNHELVKRLGGDSVAL